MNDASQESNDFMTEIGFPLIQAYSDRLIEMHAALTAVDVAAQSVGTIRGTSLAIDAYYKATIAFIRSSFPLTLRLAEMINSDEKIEEAKANIIILTALIEPKAFALLNPENIQVLVHQAESFSRLIAACVEDDAA
jgi:hypothetical protein